MRDGCTCWQCQAGCKTMPGYLEVSDLQHIPLDQLAASDGATVIDNGIVKKIPTIVPQQKPNGECVFFEGGLCTIHEHAPYGCRSHNTCWTEQPIAVERQSQRVIRELLNDVERNGSYTQARQSLQPTTLTGERRQAFQSLLNQGRMEAS